MEAQVDRVAVRAVVAMLVVTVGWVARVAEAGARAIWEVWGEKKAWVVCLGGPAASMAVMVPLAAEAARMEAKVVLGAVSMVTGAGAEGRVAARSAEATRRE